MRSLGRLISTLMFLLAALGGCSGGGRGGSSGFDISSESTAIRVALESGQCVDFESLQFCPAEARASANTPTAAPRVNTDLATATSVDCAQAAPDGPCTYVVRFVAQGFEPGTTFQALSRVDATDNPWVLGPDPRVGGADPTSFSTTLLLTAPDGGPPAQVQFAILAFSGAPPSSTEVGQLHQAEATYAFMTEELTVNLVTPPTSTPTLVPPATPTPGPNDCCQCASSCAAPVDGSCGTCTVVFGSACGPVPLCVPLPTPPTPTATPAPCVDCQFVYVGNIDDSSVAVIDTTTNLVTATIAVDGQPTGLMASPTNPLIYVGSRSGVVSSILTDSNTVVRTDAVGRQPFAIGFTPDGAAAYVTDLGLNSISILGTNRTLAVGNQPAAVAATPDGAFVYVVNTCGDGPCFPIARGTVSIIDTRFRLVTNTLTLGYRSNGIAMSPDGSVALVANQCGEDPQCASEGTLSVIDLGTQTVVDDIHITGQFSSEFIAITPDARFAYVSNTCGSSPADCSGADGSVSVVDLLTSSVVGPDIEVGGQPGSIAITPDGRTAYVAAAASNSVVAIDTATNTVDATVPIGGEPGFLTVGYVSTPTPVLPPTLTPSVTPTQPTPTISPTRTVPLPTATPPPTASSGVVGAGTADSCTDAVLNAALARGGLVTFDCGGQATIDISTGTGTKRISADTIIDGGGLITISGGNSVKIFSVNNGVTFTVKNLTIADGLVLGDNGGGIYNAGTLTVSNSTFTGNSVGGINGGDSGGGIFNDGTLTVSNSTFTGNTAGRDGGLGNGGGIYNQPDGTATITNSSFTGNAAGSDSGLGNGGGIYNAGTLTVSNSTFAGNTVRSNGGLGNGGGIYNAGMLIVTNSTFTGNDGAINNARTLSLTNSTFFGNSGGAVQSGGTLTVSGCTFAGNLTTAGCRYGGFGAHCVGGDGGAIDNTGTLSVTNSTFAGNNATRVCFNDPTQGTVCGGGSGGAIYNGGSALTVLNSTFFDNYASDKGGAIRNAITCGNAGTDPCSATLANTLVANSFSQDSCAGPITDGGHNLDDGASCGFSDANGSLSNSDPRLDPAVFQDNGGATQTIALQAGSPAINAGDDAICAAPPVNQLDQRGFTRPGTGHPHCSIGAYEFEGAPTGTPSSGPTSTPLRLPSEPTETPTLVPTASSGVVGTGTAGSCTEAALDAALARGGLVTFDCGPDPVTITLTHESEITSETTINGAGLITLDGNHAVRAFSVASGQTFSVDNLAIVHCSGGAISNGGGLTVTNSTFTGNSGGAINNSGGTLSVVNCVFSVNNSSALGGAINNSGGTITVTNSTFSDNSTAGGAAASLQTRTTASDLTEPRFSFIIVGGGAISNNGGALTVTNSTFARNRANVGGAIFNFSANGTAGTLTVANSTFAGNSLVAIRQGGALGGVRLSTVVTNSTFADNNGGAISNSLGSFSFLLVNSIFWNGAADNCSGTIIDGGHNIDSSSSCGFGANRHSLSLTYPRLDPAGLKDNGGPTQTIALLPGSPAIDDGDDAVCAAAPVNHLDQRGFTRPGTGHTHCSIGAYEFEGAPSEAPQ